MEALIVDKDTQLAAIEDEITTIKQENSESLKKVVEETVRVTTEAIVNHLTSLHNAKEIENEERLKTLNDHIELLVKTMKSSAMTASAMSPNVESTNRSRTYQPKPKH